MAVKQSKIRKKYTFLTLSLFIQYKYSILYKIYFIFNSSILGKNDLYVC